MRPAVPGPGPTQPGGCSRPRAPGPPGPPATTSTDARTHGAIADVQRPDATARTRPPAVPDAQQRDRPAAAPVGPGAPAARLLAVAWDHDLAEVGLLGAG